MISVIIPHYELHDVLMKVCLWPLFMAGGYNEVIIVDNGSEHKFDNNVPFHVKRSDKRLSFAGACNLGAKDAKGDVLVFLNNDCQVVPGWQAGIIKAFEDKKVAVVGAKMLDMAGKVQHVGVKFGKYKLPYHPHLGEEDKGFKGIKDAVALTGAFMAVRKAEFDALEGFFDYPGGNYEDVDFCLKTKEMGAKVKVSLDTVAYHIGGASYNLHPEEHTDLLVRRNWEILMDRWGDRPRKFFGIDSKSPILPREQAWGLDK